MPEEQQDGAPEAAPFDFDAHGDEALLEYRELQPTYQSFSEVVGSIIAAAVAQDEDLLVHTVEARGKDLESFRLKAMKPSASNPEEPRYSEPLRQITDLAAARVITFTLSAANQVATKIEEQFNVLEKTDKAEALVKQDKLGYQSLHYLITLTNERLGFPEYADFAGLIAEVQVRTILQHAWAEIEHDIRYKGKAELPVTIRRRFLSLAGVLEIGDREFQAIADQYAEFQRDADEKIAMGTYDGVEITTATIKAYLDKTVGPDNRLSIEWYEYFGTLLLDLGFQDLKEVDEIMSEYDAAEVSRAGWGRVQGAVKRAEDVIIAALGDNYATYHPFGNRDGFRETIEFFQNNMREAGLTIGDHIPSNQRASSET